MDATSLAAVYNLGHVPDPAPEHRPGSRALAAAAWLVFMLCAAPAQAGLTEGARLGAIYDLILDARFERAEAQLAAACPPAPAEACRALRAVSLWWQILLNPDSRVLDPPFEAAANGAIAAAEAWTRREPARGEAWFYYAGARAPLVQWRILRGERLAAAREGARIKEALERALSLDASLEDAYFGIGLYHYYADVAPAAARLLRWLLLLPGGDRERGLQEMLKARGAGELLQGEADYQLHFIYLWYEDNPRRAIELVESLDARYPGNPVFRQRIAAIHTEYFRDHGAARDAWRQLLARVADGQSSAPEVAEVSARIGLASSLLALDDVAGAVEQLTIVTDKRPPAPHGAAARAQLLLGDAHRRAGDRERAVAAYNAAIAAAPRDDPSRIRERARDAIRRKF